MQGTSQLKAMKSVDHNRKCMSLNEEFSNSNYILRDSH